MHDPAAAARRPLNGLAALPYATLAERAQSYLEAGPASSGALARDVLGLSRTPKIAAERLALALVGDDPRVTRTEDGRWTLAAQSPSPALEQCRFAVVDVETTGCSPRRGDRVIEIAVVAVADGRVDLVYDRLLDPGIPVPARVTMLTGISSAMVAGQAGFAAVTDELLRVLSGTVFVAHNARFDWAFLTQEFRRSRGLELQGPRLCTVRLARRLLPPMESRALDHVADHFGVEISARHRAAGDAVATAKILLRFLELAQEGGARTLADMTAHCAPRAKRANL